MHSIVPFTYRHLSTPIRTIESSDQIVKLLRIIGSTHLKWEARCGAHQCCMDQHRTAYELYLHTKVSNSSNFPRPLSLADFMDFGGAINTHVSIHMKSRNQMLSFRICNRKCLV